MKPAKLVLSLTLCAAGCGLTFCAAGCGESEPPAATTKEEYMANLPPEVRAEEEALQKRVDDAQANPKKAKTKGRR